MDPAAWASILIPVVVNGGALVWFASNMRTRLDRLERDVLDAKDLPGRLIRLETQLPEITATLRRIEQKVDGLQGHAS